MNRRLLILVGFVVLCSGCVAYSPYTYSYSHDPYGVCSYPYRPCRYGYGVYAYPSYRPVYYAPA